ncbi:hypothetical protein LTR94_025117, partial [Friedmanniomyces endolithicus]
MKREPRPRRRGFLGCPANRRVRLSVLSFRRPVIALVAAAAAAAVLSGCAYNEALGRSQFLLVDNAALSQQSTAAWREAIAKPGVSTSGAQVDRIRRIGGRLVQAAGLSNQPWEYAVFT